jgi:hypothetical protein
MSQRWERRLDDIVEACYDYANAFSGKSTDSKALWDRIVEWVQDIECDKCEHNRDPPDEDWRD